MISQRWAESVTDLFEHYLKNDHKPCDVIWKQSLRVWKQRWIP